MINDAFSLFFPNGYSGVCIFNGVDAATGAPNTPATGAPPNDLSNTGSDVTFAQAEPLAEEIVRQIDTLRQLNAYQDAEAHQNDLTGKIRELIKGLEAQRDSGQAKIIKYHQKGVPNMSQTGSAQSTAPSTDPLAGGLPGAPPAGGDAGMPPADTSTGMGAPMDMSAAPPPPPSTPAPPAPAMGAPAGASVPGMQTYDDLSQQNQTGVTGRGGSTLTL